ncbi:LAGLIDADG family homing endonuclease [Burkholderia ambifaria]|uniref:LAGLIDADG family homing endonuclease n=1 Tax=Burkholderia ambifaria TaxID=152480 RepID=UPI00158D6EDC|nr:LAGLIDADG family homing endonuclease [Burkholderia ambifaria]
MSVTINRMHFPSSIASPTGKLRHIRLHQPHPSSAAPSPMFCGEFPSLAAANSYATLALPDSAHILTPAGWASVLDLKKGDVVATTSNTNCTITSMKDIGSRYVFRLTFQDGRQCTVTAGQQWPIWYREWPQYRLLSTPRLWGLLLWARYRRRVSIDLFDGCFGSEVTALFSPYLLGCLIGDGCFRSRTVGFSTADAELVERLGYELRWHGLDLVFRSRYDYAIPDLRCTPNRLTAWLVALGLFGKKSAQKDIPARYLYASREGRAELLRGLMDTDGTADKNGGTSYSTSSLALASSVQQLVWSLGGKATIRAKRTKHLPHYRVYIVADDRTELFDLPRKRKRVDHLRTTHLHHRLTLLEVKEIGEAPCRRLSISASNHGCAVLTDGFVPLLLSPMPFCTQPFGTDFKSH